MKCLVVFVALFFPGSVALTQSHAVVSVSVPIQEWLQANLDWADQSGIKAPNEGVNFLPNPYLEIFDSHGKTLYRGASDVENARVLRELIRGSQSLPLESYDKTPHPPLSYYFKKIKELEPHKAQLQTQPGLVALAVSNGDSEKSKLQDSTVSEYTGQSGIAVLQIRLQF